MTRKIIYLVNPVAGTQAKSLLRNVIIQENTRRHIDFDILSTDPSGDYSFLSRRVSEENISDIVVCGGDGSINAVASAMMGKNINIGIIPMGSGNGLALAAKIPRQTSAALRIIFEGKASYIDGFYINRQFSCMLCGIGFDAKVAHDFSMQKRRGLQTYIKVTAVNFFSAKPYLFEILSNGTSFATEAFFISIANSNQFGNNFTIAPDASLTDGLLDIVIVTKMSKLLLPFSILGQVTGINAKQELSDYTEKRNIIYFQTPSLVIQNSGNAPLHIDGEPKSSSPEFRIKVVRNAIRLIQPTGA